MVTPAARRSAVAHAREAFGLSERRACSIVGVARRIIRYRSRRPDDAPIRARLRELAAERRRFGFRRLGILLAREGIEMNRKKLLRLYREEKLAVRRRGAGSVPWERGRRWLSRKAPTNAGRWISFRTL